MSEQTNRIFRRQFVSDQGEESLKGLDRSFLADPEQTRHPEIDLINQRQVLVAFGILDFIHADGVDSPERTMLQTPGDDVLDGVVYLLPRCPKRFGGFLPRKLARPAGEEQHIGSG